MSVNEYDDIAEKLTEDACYFGCNNRSMPMPEQSKLWFIIRGDNGMKKTEAISL